MFPPRASGQEHSLPTSWFDPSGLQTMRESISVVLSHSVVVTCYGSRRNSRSIHLEGGLWGGQPPFFPSQCISLPTHIPSGWNQPPQPPPCGPQGKPTGPPPSRAWTLLPAGPQTGKPNHGCRQGPHTDGSGLCPVSDLSHSSPHPTHLRTELTLPLVGLKVLVGPLRHALAHGLCVCLGGRQGQQ